MINTSNEFDNQIMEAREFVLSANITLSDGTVLALDDTDIMQGGMEFEDATSGTSSFQIGAAIINKHTLTIQNYDGKFDEYEFTDAVVRPRIGLKLSQTVETLNKGVFTVDEPNSAGGLIILECLDNMHKFERAFSEVALSFPTTLGNAAMVICTHCGVTLATTTFTNWNYTIQSRPDDKALSCLDMISYIAQCAGCFARCNINGALEIKWYDTSAFESESNLDGGTFDTATTPYSDGDSADGGNFTDYNSGDSFDGGTFLGLKKYWHFYDFGSTPTVGVDDIVITGIKVDNTNEESGYSVMFGTSGYVLSISNNPLIQSQSDAQVIANSVGAKIVGMRFRQFSASVLSNPAIEAGDPAYLSVRGRGRFNEYQGYVTNLSYKVGSRETIQNNAESPSRNSSTRYSQETKAIVASRENAKQQINSYDLAQQTFNNLVFHSFGVYRTVEEQPDGSKIEYSHDKPTLAESQNIWKQTAGVFAVSNDGGHTWRGMDAAGNILATVLNAIGVNAEWIKVLTSFTVGNNFSVNSAGILHATNAILSGQVNATSGQIGPFTLDNRGLFGQLIEIYEQNNYPLMWFTKPGDSGWGSNNSQRANVEPAVVVVREIKDGVETDASMYARDDGAGTVGKFQIYKDDSSGNTSYTVLKDGRVYYEKWESGLLKEGFDLNHEGLTVNIDGTLRSIFFRDDDIYIDGIGWRATLNRIAALEAQL